MTTTVARYVLKNTSQRCFTCAASCGSSSDPRSAPREESGRNAAKDSYRAAFFSFNARFSKNIIHSPSFRLLSQMELFSFLEFDFLRFLVDFRCMKESSSDILLNCPPEQRESYEWVTEGWDAALTLLGHNSHCFSSSSALFSWPRDSDDTVIVCCYCISSASDFHFACQSSSGLTIHS